jgi:dipeptidyl aminopeptidase/acylaminoacyl peptidase
VLRGHDRVVRSLAWSPDGRLLATASADRTVRVWDATGAGKPLVLRGHEAEVRSVAWSADGRTLVTASGDKTARLWKVAFPPVDPGKDAAALQQQLRAQVSDCLSTAHRRAYLGEGEQLARSRHERCEREHERLVEAE